MTVQPNQVYQGIPDLPTATAPLAGTEALEVVQNGQSRQATIAQILAAASAGVVPATRLINTTAPLAGGGALSSDLTLSISANGITNALFRQGVARSVVGVTGNATANVADIQGAANQVLAVNAAGTALAFGSINLAAAAAVGATILGAANGGTGAATLTANAVLLGNGVGAVAFATIGTGGRLLIDQGAAVNPAFTALSGDATLAAGGALTIAAAAITYAKIQNVAASRLLGNPTGAPAAPSEITLGATLAFSVAALQTVAHTGDVTTAANSFATTIAANAVDNTKFRQGVARSVVGVTGNATANVADIQGTADQVLVVNGAGTALAFGTVAAAGITASAVTYSKIQNVAASRLLGNPTGGAAAPSEISLGAGLSFAGAVLGVAAASGNSVQVVYTQTGAVATGGTAIPNDDTIPQNTEGDQYMTLAITPKSATNILVIETLGVFASSAGERFTLALFQDAMANALKAVQGRWEVASVPVTLPLTHIMAAGTTSATTFKARAGAGTAVTLTFNGQGGARFMGGVMGSYMKITEYAP